MLNTIKKPGFMCLAFFLILVNDIAPVTEAAVNCTSRDRAESISRNELAAGGGGGAEREFLVPGTKTAIVNFNTNIDLDIGSDIGGFAHGIVTETTAWVWQVRGNNVDNLTGFITATYQFNGLVPGDNKICANPTSCIQVTNIQAVNTQYRRNGDNNNPNNIIRRVRESIQFTMDLTGVTTTGNYTGNLEINLSIGPDQTGVSNLDLACDSIT